MREGDDHRNQLDLHLHKHEEDYASVVDHTPLHRVLRIGEVVDLRMDHHDILHVAVVDNLLVEDHEHLEVDYHNEPCHNTHREEVEFDVDNQPDDHHTHVEVDDDHNNLREEDHNHHHHHHHHHDEVEIETFHGCIEVLQLVPEFFIRESNYTLHTTHICGAANSLTFELSVVKLLTGGSEID